MIYIDPPYNTGSDGFVYQDNRTFTPEQLAELADISEEEAKRILDFTRRKSNSHSAWLTFMYPRLYIARELLREDGVIFISIDDNEQAQLKMLCDEIFGEENFLSQMTWRKTDNQANIGNMARVKEYILFYAKNFNLVKINQVPLSDKARKEYRYQDEKGFFRRAILLDKTRGTNFFELCTPSGEALMGPWMKKEDDIHQMLKEDKIYWTTGGQKQPYGKIYLHETTGQIPHDFLDTDFGSNQRASLELEKLCSRRLFDFPKPLSLIKHFLSIGSSTQSEDLILDFFAGSGTTAHAVMQLNAEDGGHRRCLSVQIDEPTDKKSEAFKAGYHTIFEITKARLEKAAAQIKEEHLDYTGDLGFKVFKTIPVFQGYLDEWNDINTTQDLFDGEQLTDQQLYSLLITWKVYDGIDLCQPLNPIPLNTYTAYSVNHLIYLMHKGFNTEDLKALITRLDEEKSFSPSKLILFGYNFDSKNQREIKEALAQYTNKKQIKMDVVVRY